MSNGLALLSSLEHDGALTSTSLTLPSSITPAEYDALGALLGRMHETTRWAIGDYIIQGESLFGQDAYQLQESLGISEESRMQYVRVALGVPPERRRSELTWSHHRHVYALSPSEQTAWLAAAVEHGWTRDQLGERMRGDDEQQPRANLREVAGAARDLFNGAEWNGSEFVVSVGLMASLGDALGLEHPSGAYVD